MDCTGTWRTWDRVADEDPDRDPAIVMRCDGCGEMEVMLPVGSASLAKHPAQGAYPPDMRPIDCVAMALAERALRR